MKVQCKYWEEGRQQFIKAWEENKQNGQKDGLTQKEQTSNS